MDKIREELIEILNDVQRHGAGYTEHERYGIRLDDEVWNEEVADHLISKGVTIDRWIPVSEMLPEDMPENKGKKVINCIVAHPPYKNGKLVSQFRQRKYGGDDYGWYWSKIGSCCVTHWKPMPEPPIKQEESKLSTLLR